MARFALRAGGGTMGIPAIWYLGFSSRVPPGNLPQFRLALAHAIDRSAVARAAAPLAAIPGAQPAANIQNPSLAGSGGAVRGQSYDPAKARELYVQSAWTSPIRIVTSSSTTQWGTAIERAVAESISASIGAAVTFEKAGLDASTRSGDVPVWVTGWRADVRDFGYPSMALGIADTYFKYDPEVRAFVERRAGQELEQMLLDKALIVPIIFYASCDR
jgi:ABC-type transport system substrate-binding protein